MPGKLAKHWDAWHWHKQQVLPWLTLPAVSICRDVFDSAKAWIVSFLPKGGLQSPNKTFKRGKASPCSHCQSPTQQHCPRLLPKAHMSAVQTWRCLLVLHCCQIGSGAGNHLHGLPPQHCHPVWQSCMSRSCCWDDHTASAACLSSVSRTSPASHMHTDALKFCEVNNISPCPGVWSVKCSRTLCAVFMPRNVNI